MYEMKKEFTNLQTPAVWLLHGILGISTSDPLKASENTLQPVLFAYIASDAGQYRMITVWKSVNFK